jgi:hypothetical protein
MLCREALESALPLTERLDRAGKIVHAVTGTPLDMMVRASRSGPNFSIQVGTVYQPSIADIEYLANARDGIDGTCEHDVVSDQMIAMAAQGVRNHLVVVRTGVKPAILALHDAVKQKMTDLPTSSILGMEVKIHDLPEPMKNAAIEGLISKFETVPLESPALRMRCPQVDLDQLKELLHTGARGFDADVDQWIAVKGDSWFLQLWDDIFTTKNDHWDSFRDAIECRECGLDRAMAIFLIANKLSENAIEGITMALPAFQALAQQYRDQAAAKIRRALDDWAATVKRQILVKQVNGRCVTVNECVYRPWIAAGGSNDLLFGSLISGAGYISVPQIDGNAAELQRAWNRQVGLTNNVEAGARFNALKQILFAEYRKSNNDLKDEGSVDVSAAARETMLAKFKNELNQVKESDCANLYTVCLKLICRSRFDGTDAEEFLLNMQSIQEQNPDLDVREAATIATIDYIACWVADQFRVTDVGR